MVTKKGNNSNSKVNVLCVLGSNDPSLKKNLNFWKTNHKRGRFNSYKEAIIEGSDHSFMGWSFKKKLTKVVSDWLKD